MTSVRRPATARGLPIATPGRLHAVRAWCARPTPPVQPIGGSATPSAVCLDAIRVKREYLIQQIRESERTIEQSRELIERLDELLIKAGLKP
jgi:hypothetical protein